MCEIRERIGTNYRRTTASNLEGGDGDGRERGEEEEGGDKGDGERDEDG